MSPEHRRAVNRIDALFFGGMGKRRFELWLEVVGELPGEAVETAAEELCRDWTDRAKPNPAHLREWAINVQRRNPPPPDPEPDVEPISDEHAAKLRDAVAKIKAEPKPQSKGSIPPPDPRYQPPPEVETRGVRYVQAAPHPYDPPGTIRWVVVQPDGSNVPEGARKAGR